MYKKALGVAIALTLAINTNMSATEQTPTTPSTPLYTSGQWVLPNSEQVSKYLHNVVKLSPFAEIRQLGQSAGGRPIDALLISTSKTFLKTGQPDSERMTVFMVASRRNNEPAASEAFQLLAERIIQGDLSHLLETMNLVIVALANPDSRDNVASSETSDNDFITAHSDMSRLFIDALEFYKPDVVYDAREYRAYRPVLSKQEGYIVNTATQFEAGNSPNIDYQLGKYSSGYFLEQLIKAANDDGINATRYRGEIDALEQTVSRGDPGITNMRNYAALQGAVSIVAETRLDAEHGKFSTPGDIKRRINRQLKSAEVVLKLLVREEENILPLARSAKSNWHSDTRDGKRIALDVRLIPNLDKKEVDIPLSRIKSGKPVVKSFPNSDWILAENKQDLPKAYLINRHIAEFAELLERHHIPFTRVQQGRKVKAVSRTINDITIIDRPMMGVRRFVLNMKFSSTTEEISAAPGDLIVPTDGAKGALAGVMLNPQSTNAIYQEGKFQKLLLQDGPLPVKDVVN